MGSKEDYVAQELCNAKEDLRDGKFFDCYDRLNKLQNQVESTKSITLLIEEIEEILIREFKCSKIQANLVANEIKDLDLKEGETEND